MAPRPDAGTIGEPVTLALRHRGEAQLVEIAVRRALINIESIKGFAKTEERGKVEWRLPTGG